MGIARDFVSLAKLNMANADFDCIYPLVVRLAKQGGWADHERVWYCILYMTFYNESSALVYFHRPRSAVRSYPIDTARRCLRGGRIVRHLQSWQALTTTGNITKYLCEGFTDDRRDNWCKLLAKLKQVYGNGRWAAYTTADLLHKVCGFEVTPTCTGWRQSSGPKDGLQRLPPAKLTLDKREQHWYIVVGQSARRHLQREYWPEGWDYGVLESLLCDWSGLTKGSYYSGRNIDRMLTRMGKVIDSVGPVPVLAEILKARREVFAVDQLGEYNGWLGIDPARKKHYVKTGEVLCSKENRGSITGATSLTSFLQARWSG